MKFKQKFLKLALTLKQKKTTWGFWLRRCLEHFYIHSIAWIGNLTVYSAESYEEQNIRQAFYQWYENGRLPSDIDVKSYEDDCPVKGK